MASQENDQGRKRAASARPPRVRHLLERVRELCESRMQPPLKRTLDDFDEQMFQLADQANNNTEQEICMAAQREVRRGRSDLAPRFLSLLTVGFAHPGNGAGHGAGHADDSGDLMLVGIDEQEEEVTLGAAAARTELRAGMSLLELGYRFATLDGIPVVESDVLPLGPHAICTAWQRATSELDLPPNHRRHLHQLFDKHLLQAMPAMFEAVNALMTDQGILPNLRTLLSRRMHKTASGKSAGPDADNAAPEDEQGYYETAPSPGAPRSGHEETSAAFSVLRGLLARRRSALGLDTEIATDAPVSTSEQLQSALAKLQRQPASTVLGNGQEQLRDMQHLRQDLKSQLSSFSDDGKPLAFNAAQNDTIDLMSMLFDHLGRDMPAEGQAATMMTRLQVPMLRVALSDPEFFSQHEHPARRLLGSVLDTATQWLDGAGEAADPVLAKKLQHVVDSTVEDFDGNVELLDQLREDLDNQLSVLRRRAEISERRHLEAAQGRERLQVARDRASELVAERLQSSDASGLVRTMMEQAWTDVLALSMLRWGERSKSFRDRLEVTDRLLRRKTDNQDDPDLREEISQGLGQVGIHGEEAEQIARRVVTPQADTEKDQELTRTELAMRLKQHQRLGRADKQEADDAQAQPPEDPATQEAIERLRQLAFGSWLEFVRPQGHVVRRKLAWFSPTTGHCLVVNQRGAREDIADLKELGAAMAAGRVRIPEEDSESLLDRAWSAILGGLRKFAQTAAEQSA
jgi:hypothetical protein